MNTTSAKNSRRFALAWLVANEIRHHSLLRFDISVHVPIDCEPNMQHFTK